MKHLVRVEMRQFIEVEAPTAAIAEEIVADRHPRAHTVVVDRSFWEERAKEMLDDGASYAEVGRTLRKSPKNIRKALPGYGWTQSQGAQWREHKRAMEEIR